MGILPAVMAVLLFPQPVVAGEDAELAEIERLQIYGNALRGTLDPDRKVVELEKEVKEGKVAKPTLAERLIDGLEDARPAIKFISARALNLALFPFVNPAPFVPDEVLSEKIMANALTQLNGASEAGVRRELFELVAWTSVHAPEIARGHVNEILAKIDSALDPQEDGRVAEGAAFAMATQPIATSQNIRSRAAGIVQKMRTHPNPAVRDKVVRGETPEPSSYQPVENARPLAEFQASDADLAGAYAQASNVAQNFRRDPKGPQATTDAPPAHHGGDALSLLRGDALCLNNFGNYCGVALGGGGYAGVDGGWHHVTVSLPRIQVVSEFVVVTYGGGNTPKSYRLAACLKETCDDKTDWAVVVVNENNRTCTDNSPMYCRLSITTGAIKARKLRWEIDDESLWYVHEGRRHRSHLWITRVEVLSPPRATN